MKRLKKLFEFWGLVVFWGLMIFLVSSRPAVVVSEIYWPDFVVKKTGHLIVFGILFTLLYRALKETTRLQVFRVAFVSFLLSVLYGLSDEYHQTFVPGRQGLLRDVIIDGLGAGIAWWLIWKWLPKAPKRLKNWAKRLALS